MWGNTATSYPEIRNENGNPTISHCDIAGCGGSGGWVSSFGTDGGGNIDDNPLFVSSSDIHLQDGSLCINAGNNSAPSLPATDFEGNPRILNGTVDIGADEWGFEYILASAPQPSDGSSDVSIDSDLSWTAHADAVSHDIWFGTYNPPTTLLAQECPNTTIDPGTLHYGTVYYWQVDEVTLSGTAAGTVWSFSTPPGLGSGTEEEPYQISTFVQLQFVSQMPDYWDMHFVVTDDIVIGPGVSCIPIGNVSEHFNGVFDGNGHVIRGLHVTGAEYLGLFGIVGSYGLVENLGVEDAVIECTVGSAGILAGRNDYGKISNCYSTGAVNGGDNSQFLGGLVGDNDGTNSISYCYSTAAITCAYNPSYLGGLLGSNGGSITHCYSTGSVSGGDSSHSLGGLIGGNASFGCDIDNCYSTGAVTGGNDCGNLGGLIGFHSNGGINNDITISDCYSTGAVTSGDSAGSVGGLVGTKNGPINNCYSVGKITLGTAPVNFGGLVGRNLMGSTSRCFWDKEASGILTSSGGTGKTTAEMKMTATFTDWDFENTWEILENQSYPYQVIEAGPEPPIEGDVDGDGDVDFEDFAILANNWLAGK